MSRRTAHEHSGRGARGALALVAALLLVSAVGPLPGRPGPADAAEEPIVAIGKWRPPLLPASAQTGAAARRTFFEGARYLLDPGARRLYQLFPGWIASYHLDTLEPVGPPYTYTGRLLRSHYVDPQTGTLFAIFSTTGVGGETWIEQFVSTPQGLRSLVRSDLSATLFGLQPTGIYRPPGSDLLYVLADVVGRTAIGAGGAPGVVLLELSQSEPARPIVVDWQLPLPPDCFRTVRRADHVWAAMGYVPEKSALYFGCGSGLLTNSGNTGDFAPRGAARVVLHGDPRTGPTTLPTAADFTVFQRDGSLASADSLFDPGSGRLFLITGGSGGNRMHGFDTRLDAYVGTVATGSNSVQAVGHDPLLGRLYLGSSDRATGLVVTDAEPTPLAQGLALGHLIQTASFGIGPLPVDPVTRRLFLRPTGEEELIIAVDRRPRYVAPPSPDLDAATVDVEEQPGVTARTFGASVQGYGARLRQVGGFGAMAINYAVIDTRRTGVGAGTREMRAAHVDTLRLGTDEASAAAISLDRDRANTQADFDKVAPPDGAPLVPWPVGQARCFDFGSASADVAVDDSRVTCDGSGHRASVSSTAKPVSVPHVVTVEAGSVDGVTRLDARRGAVASITSTARGIDLLDGLVHIGSVETTSESVARGRPGTATSSFERTIRHVTVQGEPICGDECDPEAVAPRLNAALGGRVRVTFPVPEEAVRTSKGGYQAVNRRRASEHLEETLLNAQSAERTDVPGMVVVLYQDAELSSRTIVELGSVGTEAHYGISLLSDGTDDGFDGAGLGDDGADGPVFGGSDGSFSDVALPAFEGAGSGATSVGPLAPLGASRGRLLPGTAGRFLLNAAGLVLDLFPIWALLLGPVYVSSRRRLLQRRSWTALGGPA